MAHYFKRDRSFQEIKDFVKPGDFRKHEVRNALLKKEYKEKLAKFYPKCIFGKDAHNELTGFMTVRCT